MSSKQTKTETAPATKRVASLAHDSIDNASEKAAQVERKLRAETERIAEKSGDTAVAAKEQIDATITRVEGFVKERPFAAAGIAFAAGVVGALLLKRS